jgi:hypothetical protein
MLQPWIVWFGFGPMYYLSRWVAAWVVGGLGVVCLWAGGTFVSQVLQSVAG